MHKAPSQTPCNSLFSLSIIEGYIPKKGKVADPGFNFVAPTSGVIKKPPVSVYHHVSIIGHLSSPQTL